MFSGKQQIAAARLVKVAQSLQSSIFLKANEKIADARSILSILLLCASLGTLIELEANGVDEEQALNAVCPVLQSEEFDLEALEGSGPDMPDAFLGDIQAWE